MDIETKAPFHILLADDDADDRQFFAEAISELDIAHVMTVFKDGAELMDFLQSTSETPNILFLDLNMPRKTGLECLQEIRDEERLANLAIAIYSTSSSEKDIEASFLGGADLYIKKPNDFAKLKKAIREVVNLYWKYHATGQKMETFVFSI